MLVLSSIFPTLFYLFISSNTDWKKNEIIGFAQGTNYSVLYYTKSNTVSKMQIDSIFGTIDYSLSIYNEHSLISKFNASKKGIQVDEHFINVVRRSSEIHNTTKGLFDITILPLMELWGFKQKGIMPVQPSKIEIQSIRKCVGMNLLEIKGNNVVKKKPCVKIDVNGIAQGYSVDVVTQFLLSHNISNFIVEVGGEVRVNGRHQPSGKMMRVGIQMPKENDSILVPTQKIIIIGNGAITTSGNYRKFYESKAKKISHLMNPKSGKPIDNDLISVTVFAKDAATADGFDNALMVLGLKKAIKFAENSTEIEAYFIYKDKLGKVKDTATVNFYKFIQ